MTGRGAFGPFEVASCTDQGATIVVESPFARHDLMNQVAHMRQVVFGGVQVPFRIMITDPETGITTEEHIAGCASCGAGEVR